MRQLRALARLVGVSAAAKTDDMPDDIAPGEEEDADENAEGDDAPAAKKKVAKKKPPMADDADENASAGVLHPLAADLIPDATVDARVTTISADTLAANERWATVLRGDAAKGRTDAAVELLSGTELAADAILAMLPKLGAADGAEAMLATITGAPQPNLGSGTDAERKSASATAWDKALSRLNATTNK
jgi:hypothetical protein